MKGLTDDEINLKILRETRLNLLEERDGLRAKIARLTRERDEWMQQYEMLVRTNQHAHQKLAETLTKLARERDEARELLREIREEHDERLFDNILCDCEWCERARKLLEGKP